MYGLLRAVRAGRHPADWAAVVGALLFALHPVQTEAVTYVCRRSVSLMALFYLGSALVWLHADRAADSGTWRAMSALLFSTALPVKETTVTLPFALLLLDAIDGRQRPAVTQMLRRQLWHELVLLGALLAMAASSRYRHLLETGLSARSVPDNLLTQAHAFW